MDRPERGLQRTGVLPNPLSFAPKGQGTASSSRAPAGCLRPGERCAGHGDGGETGGTSPSQGLLSKTGEEGSSGERPGLPLATEKGRKPTS